MSAVDVKNEISFEKGLPGFPHLNRFVLQQSNPELPLAVLQSVDEEEVSFLIGDPFSFFPEYEFDLPSEAEIGLKVKDPNELEIWVIITFRGTLRDSTMNLKAPIVFNKVSLCGKQVILNDSRYSLRQPLIVNSTNGGLNDASIEP